MLFFFTIETISYNACAIFWVTNRGTKGILTLLWNVIAAMFQISVSFKKM